MKSKIARIVSWVLNPFVLLIPTQAVLFGSYSSGFSDWRFYVVIFCQVIAILLFVFVSCQLGDVSDLELTNREEREKFVFWVFSLFAVSVVITASDPDLALSNLGLSLASFVVAVITNFFDWKVSGHLAYDTVIVFVLASVSPWFWLGAAALPLVAWSRVVQGKHTWPQVFAGFLAGAFASAFLL